MTDEQADGMIADSYASFRKDPLPPPRPPRPRYCRRSKKGNATRKVGRVWLTVFPRPWGEFCWSLAVGDDVRFSPDTYPTEREAKDAAMLEALRCGDCRRY